MPFTFSPCVLEDGTVIAGLYEVRPRVFTDAAEDDEETCCRLNAVGPGLIGKAAEKKGALVLHISTDYVFDGNANRPYREDDAAAPTGVYGATKLAGEKALFAACSRAYAVRSAWLYGAFGKTS